MGELADYEPEPSSSVAAIAAARGVSPYDVVYDVLLERDGHGMLLVTSTNYAEGNLDTTLELMRNDRAVVALGDGGAHYGMICDASYTTYTLTHWARDRRRERIDIAEAVRMLTDVPARLQRFSDRGRIAPGMKVLEPSCGRGALALAAAELVGLDGVTCHELMPENTVWTPTGSGSPVIVDQDTPEKFFRLRKPQP